MRRFQRTRALAGLLGLVCAATVDAADVNGYVSSRTQYTQVRADGLLASDDIATFSELVEVNAQVRQDYLERAFVYGDLSIFGQFAGGYQGRNDDGEVATLPDRDVPGSRPFISVNELYLNHEFFPELVVTAGKKRVVWGSGMAFNPTDLLNPAKDPTDPSLQRAGAWLAQIEIPLETMTFSVLASPRVTATANGVPYRFLYHPSWNEVDRQAHWLAAARMYALWADTDVNLMLFYGNGHPDPFENKLRGGLSLSRIFADVNEFHVEALLQTGSPRAAINGECVTSTEAAARCAVDKKPFLLDDGLTDPTLRPRVLVGARRQFEDDSMLSIEYLYQADGYTRAQVQDLVNGLSVLRSASTIGVGAPGALTGDAGIPTRFQFQPVGQHYLFATFQKPRIRDDFTAQLTAIASLQDFSVMLAPMVSWSTTPWLTLSASGFVPLSGPESMAAQIPVTQEPASEYGLAPMYWRGLFEARVFY